jgi:hypothetical protein
VRVELEDVEQTRERLPARWGVSSPPGLSGYAPEGMFDRLVHRRVRRKAAKGQALQLHFLMSEDAIDPAAGDALFGDQLAR